MTTRCKIILAGDAGVGKTSLFFSYADGRFPTDYLTTIGVDFRFKYIDVDGERVKLQIWDTAGQERYRGITSSYYKGADIVILVFDITRRSTFAALRDWSTLAQSHGARILVVGNKADLSVYREVSQEAAGTFAASLDAGYLDVSAKRDPVDEVFERLARDVVRSRPTPELPTSLTVTLLPNPNQPRRRFFSGLC